MSRLGQTTIRVRRPAGRIHRLKGRKPSEVFEHLAKGVGNILKLYADVNYLL